MAVVTTRDPIRRRPEHQPRDGSLRSLSCPRW